MAKHEAAKTLSQLGTIAISLEKFWFWLTVAIVGSLMIGVVGTIVPLRIGIKAFQKMEF